MTKPKNSGGRPAVTKPHKSGRLIPRKELSASRNASGYKKRQERKKNNVQMDDLYEFSAAKNKRAGITLDMDREERAGYDPSRNGATDEDDLDVGMETLRRKISASMEGDVGIVESEDDEDIDSDEAFEGESDEERFGNFKFAHKGTLSKRRSEYPSPLPKTRFASSHTAEIDLNEDDIAPSASRVSPHSDSEEEREESDEESDDGDDGDVPLSTILGDDMHPPSEASHSDSDSESLDDDEEDVLAPSDDDASSLEGAGALEKLDRFIDELNPAQKRKVSELEGDGNVSRKRKRKNLEERNEAGMENEFATRGGPDDKLSLDDLLKPLDNSELNEVNLGKTARMLASTKVESLAAPLPTRAQERLDRQAAYETTKEEVGKWAPTMKRIREAEHLSFPLQKPPVIKPSTSGLNGKFRPSNEMESAVDKLLKSAKLRETDIEKKEELEMAHLTVEEVAARRAELRHMRELMFHAEAKAKRVAKIKSKTYRKIHKKAREKNALTLDEIATLDPEAATAERIKIEAARAKERATMRHKNTGKWAKQMNSRGQNLDIDQRRELNAQLERGEMLRRKIQGVDEDGDGLEDSPSDPDEAVQDIADHAFDELRALQAEGVPASPPGKMKTGLLGMKFMRAAADRDNREVDAMVDGFQDELIGLTPDNDDVQTPYTPTLSDSVVVRGNEGRMIFKPSAEEPTSTSKVIAQFSMETDASSTTIKSSVEPNGDSPQLRPSLVEESTSAARQLMTEVENPWLAIANKSPRLSRKTNQTLVSKGSAVDVKSQATLKKHLAQSEDALAHRAEDAVVEIDLDNPLSLPAVPGPPEATSAKQRKPNRNIKGTAVDSAFQDSDDEDVGPDNGHQSAKAFKQRDLVALAFAGDNVVEEFNSSKQREIEATAPREIDTTLPGWGTWGGKGVRRSNSKPKPHLIKKISGIEPGSRADAGKAHVIISERKDKKASKYLVKDLPYPYTSKAQFERSLEQPVGPEWNTRIGFQKGTLPKVVKKMGTVIDPLQRIF